MYKRTFWLVLYVFSAYLFLPVATGAAPPAVRHDGNNPNLIGLWHLDETSGTTAADSKGGDNNGTISCTGSFNTWSWGATGKFGTGLSMNTSNTIMGARLQFPMTGMSAARGSVAMWAKLATQPVVSTTQSRYFTGWQGRTVSASKTNDRVQLYLANISGDPEAFTELCVGMGDQNKLDQFIKHLTVGEWYHLALTWNQTNATTGDGSYQLYVNGIDMPAGTMRTGYTPNTYKNLSGMAYNAQLGNNMADIPSAAKNEGGAETLDEVGFYDAVLTRAEVVALAGADPNKAWNPTPDNGYTDISINPTLSWSAGAGAASHDVYFGTVLDQFQTNQAGTSWSPPETLGYVTTYYWRINERDSNDNLTATGDLWSFTTIAGMAANPSPYNGRYNVAVPVTLAWKPGDTSGITHDVYFGTNSASPTYIGNQAIGSTTYTPTIILLDKRYYWRIDEVQTSGTTFTGNTWTFTVNPTYYADDFQTYANTIALKNAWKTTGTTSASYVYQDVAGTDKAVDFWYDNQTSPYFAGIKRSVPAPQSTSRDYTFGGSAYTLRVSYKADANTDQIYVRLHSGGSSVKRVRTGVVENGSWNEALFAISDFGVATSVTAIEVGEGNDTTPLSGQGYLYVDDYRIRAIRIYYLPGDLNYDGVVNFTDLSLLFSNWLAPPVSLINNGQFNKGTWGTTPPNAQTNVSGNDPATWPRYWYMWNDTAQTTSDFALTLDSSDGQPLGEPSPCAKLDLDMSTTAWNDGAICQTIDVCDYNGSDLLISFMHKGDITAQDDTMYEYRPTMDGCSTDDTAGEPIIKRVQRGGGTTCPDCYGALTWDWEPYTHIMTVNLAALDGRGRKSRYLHLHHRLSGRADSSANPPQWLKIDVVTATQVGGPPLPVGDLTLDGIGEGPTAVNLYDLAILAGNWLRTQQQSD